MTCGNLSVTVPRTVCEERLIEYMAFPKPMPESTSSRLFLSINGTLREDISEDIISASFDDSIDILTLTLSNWDAGEYTYSNSALLKLGMRLELHMGPDPSNLKMFEGAITAIAPIFAADKPSVILIEATGMPQAKDARIAVSLGRELVEFKPILAAGSTAIECAGVTEGNPDLQKGAMIAIGGVGQSFDRLYFVTKTIHVFDSESGYKTHFTASSRRPRNFRESRLNIH